MNDFDLVVMQFMQDFPMTANYVKTVVGDYDPAQGEAITSEVIVPVEALLMDLDLQSNGMSLKYGTQIVAGDKELFVRPPNKTDPAADQLQIDTSADRVEVGGVVYKIVTFKEVNPTGIDPIMYMMYLRR